MTSISIKLLCDYRRCGGLGQRETRKARRARVRLTVRSGSGSREWHVCEGCADLLTASARRDGFDVLREPQEARRERDRGDRATLPRRGLAKRRCSQAYRERR